MLIRNLAIVAVTIVVLAIGFVAGRYYKDSSTEADRLLAEEMIKEELVTAALTSEQVRDLRDGQIDKVVGFLNGEIDSSLFVADALLKYNSDESTRWFADNMLIRIANDREHYSHNPSPIWEGKIEEIIVQARSRVEARTRSKPEAEPVDDGNAEKPSGDERPQ